MLGIMCWTPRREIQQLILSAYVMHGGQAGSPPLWVHGAPTGHPPVWVTVIVVGCFLANVALGAWLASKGDDGSDDDTGGEGGPGGPPPGPQPPGDPAWWPKFERELAAYIAAQRGKDRERETPALPSRSKGADRNRTGVNGFAGRCVTTPPRRRSGSSVAGAQAGSRLGELGSCMPQNRWRSGRDRVCLS